MTKLPVPVDIDNESGAWMSEGQPMILIPRRFWVFVQKQAEEQFGLVATAELFNHATRKGTRVWCEQEELRSGACREEVLKRYFDRVSARGMGRFAIKSIDVDTGHLAVELHNSIYVAEYGNEGVFAIRLPPQWRVRWSIWRAGLPFRVRRYRARKYAAKRMDIAIVYSKQGQEKIWNIQSANCRSCPACLHF